MRNIELNQIQLDALREISSIAAGNTATSLSTMLDKKVDITVPNIMVEALEMVPEALGGREEIRNVIHFSVSGQILGNILLILPTSESLKLINVFTDQEVTQVENLDEMALSALKELGNITVGTYLRALGQELEMKITYSIPEFASDMLGAIFDQILAKLSLQAEYAVMVENEFTVEEVVYQTHLIFIPEPKTLKVMLKALGVWESEYGEE